MPDRFQTSRELLLTSQARLAKSEVHHAALQDSLVRTRHVIQSTVRLIDRSDELIDSIEVAYANRERAATLL
jgi:hypothetical protein